MAETPPKGDRTAGSPVQSCPEKTENIIIIGSELSYDSFWLKMMFMSCGIGLGKGSLMPPGWGTADKTTVLYCRSGYVRHELLAVEALRDRFGHELVAIASPATVTARMSTRFHQGDRYKINHLAIFSHGTPGAIRLEYPRRSGDLTFSTFASVPSDVFCPSGSIISYACNTAYAETGPSLAQRLATHFGVTVKAFDGLTNYGHCLRASAQSASITAAMKAATKDGSVINISSEHEGLPHDGLGGWGAWREGTQDYALWRKAAARGLPVQHPGSGSGMRDYR